MRPSTAEYVKLDDCDKDERLSKAVVVSRPPSRVLPHRAPTTSTRPSRSTWWYYSIRARQGLWVLLGLALNFIIVCVAISFFTYIFTKRSSQPPTPVLTANVTVAVTAQPTSSPDFAHPKTIVEWGTNIGFLIAGLVVLGAELGIFLGVIALVSAFVLLMVIELEDKLRAEAAKAHRRTSPV
ncbi:hypothetical protein PENSPDRAFT_652117 [Peniophora sp. CONT]|nr:hypothetical protein PENSPDRAFT_652117 [Peniophora sp. CONT]